MLSYSDYLMVITLPQHIKNALGRYKRAAVNRVGHFEGVHHDVHMVITHQVRCKPFMVQPAVIRIEQKFKTIAPVQLFIKGFGYFKHGPYAMTIYAVIETDTTNSNWFRLIMNEIGVKEKDFVPHIVLVKNIPVTLFNKLWPHFERNPYKETFKAHSLILLQRETFADNNEWHVYKEVFFGERVMPF